MSAFSQTFELYALDALRAFPAALARVLLGYRTDRRRVKLPAWHTVGTVIGSMALAVMCGDLSRINPAIAQHSAMIVIAVAFNAQDTATRLICFYNPLMRYLDRQARDRITKRYHDHDGRN